MKKRKSQNLTREDKILWGRIAETTTPLTAKRGQFLKDQMSKLMEESSPAQSPQTQKPQPVQILSQKVVPPSAVPPSPNRLDFHPIDKPVVKKLAKGRVQIDSRIDLHGMTQDRAQFALLDFLQMAQRANHRIVLVITGKGNEGLGVLRQNVPHWLRQPRFAALVNGTQQAHASHGGDGALYVRIRKLNTHSRS